MSDIDALRTKYLETLLEAAGKNLSPEARKASAVIVRTKADGTKEYKFPIPDKNHARLALAMLDGSDLSAGEKAKVKAKAESMLEAGKKSMPPWIKENESKEKEVPGSKADQAEDKAEGEKDNYSKKPWMKGKKEAMKEMGTMVPAGDGLLPKKGGPKAKKDMMKEANGMIGGLADPNSPTNKKMVKDWEGGGETGQTGDPKKKPVKSQKSWLVKGTPTKTAQPPSGDAPVVPD